MPATDPHDDNEQTGARPAEREYERSGMYPKDGKPYRLWGLLGALLLVVVLVAGASAVLNFVYSP